MKFCRGNPEFCWHHFNTNSFSLKGEYQREINELYAKIGLPISSDEERRKSLTRLKLLEKRQRELSEGYGEQIAQLEVKVKNKEQHLKSLTTQKKNKERDIESLDLERALYEIKTEKDRLMSNLKTLLINLSSYAQRQYLRVSQLYFGEHEEDILSAGWTCKGKEEES